MLCLPLSVTTMPLSAGPAHPLHLDERRGGGLRRLLGGIHVTVRGSLVAMLVFAGWVTDGTPARALQWVWAGTLALLLHELAHAWMARRAGVEPHVELSWRGGLTRWPDDHLPPATAARVLLAGPLAGLVVALAVERLGRLVPTDSVLGAVTVETLSILGGISVVVAALDLLPIFPRDGSRLLLLVLRGNPVDQVVRAASFGAVAAALATAALVISPARELAIVTGVLLVTNTWLAVWGDRAVGQRVEDAIESGDWLSIRRRVAAGCDSPSLAALAQHHALAAGAYAEAADIGDAALDRGWLTIGFATRTAKARMFLEEDDRAMERVKDAVALGAHPDDLAKEGILRPLTLRLDWPSAERRTHDEFDEFVIDLRDEVTDLRDGAPDPA